MGVFDGNSARIHQDIGAVTHLREQSLKFLADLRNNNNREWFEANKLRFQDAKSDFETFVGMLIGEIAKFDAPIASLEPKKSIFRIYRDTRFSKDKSPYKSSLGAHLLAGGRKGERGRAGYYIHISPGDCFLAGGAHLPAAGWMAEIRREICDNAIDLRRIAGTKIFKKFFGEIEGETLKSAPRGYPRDHPQIDLLKRKSFLAVHRMADKTVTSAGFLMHATTVFKALYPFGQFLNRGSS